MAFTYESIGSHRVTDIFKVDDWFGGCCDRSHEIEEGEETPRNDGSRWDRCSVVALLVCLRLNWEGTAELIQLLGPGLGDFYL